MISKRPYVIWEGNNPAVQYVLNFFFTLIHHERRAQQSINRERKIVWR